MVKRYWVEEHFINTEKPTRKGEGYFIEIAIWDDITDSLIEWHDLQENPDDLPDDNERLIIAKYNKLESFISFNDYDITYGEYICLNRKSYTYWAYFKPPLIHKEQSK